MELSELLTALSHKQVYGRVDVDIAGLANDSRRARPGDLFVAIRGLDADGHDFIPDAIRQGAVAVVGEREASRLKFSKLGSTRGYYTECSRFMQTLAAYTQQASACKEALAPNGTFVSMHKVDY